MKLLPWPKFGECESRSQRKDRLQREEAEQLNAEQDQLIKEQMSKLQKLIQNQNEGLEEDREHRARLKDAYLKQAQIEKYRHVMRQRQSTTSSMLILQEVGSYSIDFLMMRTDDEVLFKYKRKLQKKMQWILL